VVKRRQIVLHIVW